MTLILLQPQKKLEMSDKSPTAVIVLAGVIMFMLIILHQVGGGFFG